MTAAPLADAVVVGGGLVGLCCAVAIARDGGRVVLLDQSHPGSASGAAAGMLAPSIDRGSGPAMEFATAARDMYPRYLQWLQDETGIAVPLNDRGILQVALTDAGVRGLRRAMARESDLAAEWLDAPTVHQLEPGLSHALGAVYHPRDGAVDNVALLAALDEWCRSSTGVRRVPSSGAGIVPAADGLAVRAADGTLWPARFVVLAAGAWASLIAGLPRALAVAPLRGQMLAYPETPLRHVVFGPRGYVVPRSASPAGAMVAETLVGATSERTAFDTGTTPAAAESLRAAASEILPALVRQPPVRQWAGLRPMTPDLQPIIGPDPELPSLLYACGHSRNGVLMAPITGECISALVRGLPAPYDLHPFSIARFARA